MSKRKFFYDSIEDSQRRLNGTVVLLDGEPALVNAVNGLNTDQIASVMPIPYSPRTAPIEAPLIPKRFTIRNLPPLGYVDYKDHSHYMMRVPSRQTKQGYCRANTQISPNPLGGTPTFEGIMNTKQFQAMMAGKYARFTNVFDEILASENPLKRAFCKQMALDIDDMESITLEHRGMKVAVANNPRKYGPVFRLPKKFQYLTEELQEFGVRVE